MCRLLPNQSKNANQKPKQMHICYGNDWFDAIKTYLNPLEIGMAGQESIKQIFAVMESLSIKLRH